MPRTLLKTCTYCIMHFTVAILVAFALTRDWRIALAVGVVEPLVQTGFFAMHEKLWSRAPERVTFGRLGRSRPSRRPTMVGLA